MWCRLQEGNSKGQTIAGVQHVHVDRHDVSLVRARLKLTKGYYGCV